MRTIFWWRYDYMRVGSGNHDRDTTLVLWQGADVRPPAVIVVDIVVDINVYG
jgi:hypothetical protein